ncbi:hypothetical protein DK871_27315 [Pseudomonas sp. L13]|nr:hypothetical protein [Pseudomonas sp. L13]
MLAKNSQAPRLFWMRTLSLTFFASKLAPTGDWCRALIPWAMHGQCGSWLACDSGGSVEDSVTDTPPSRASPHTLDLRALRATDTTTSPTPAVASATPCHPERSCAAPG